MSTQQCDNLVNAAGTGAPDTPHGLKLAGGSDPLTVYKPWAAVTPTFVGLGSPSNVVVYARQIGDTWEAQGTFTTGTCTAVAAAIILPSGIVIDSSKIPFGVHNSFTGMCFRMTSNNLWAATGSVPVLYWDGGTTDRLFIASTSSVGAFTGTNGSAAFGNSEVVNFRIFGIPVV